MEAKKIIITGGATRIGAAIAKSLAGYEVDITVHYNKSKNSANRLKKELENLGSKVFLIKADLNNSYNVQRLIRDAFKKMKGLDCLINNASVFENDNLLNLNDKSFSKHFNVNLKAPAYLSREFSKNTGKSKNANIINIIDQRVFKLTPFFFSYTLSKTGLFTLTKTSAMTLAPKIRVNGIAPGPTLKNVRQSNQHFKKQYLSTPLRRQVDVTQICSSVDFFIKNRSITGQIVAVDSGQNLNWQTPDIIGLKE